MKCKLVWDGKNWRLRFPQELVPPQDLSWFVTAHFIQALGYYYFGDRTSAGNSQYAWYHMRLAEAHLHRSKHGS